MPAGFRALRHEDVGASFGGAESFGNFTGHMHDFSAGIVGALKVVAQVLVFARPCKGDDGRSSTQRDREHVLLDLKQQMIDAEWFFGALVDRSNLGIEGW